MSNGEPARGVRGVLRMLGAVWEKSDEALYGRNKITKGEAERFSTLTVREDG